VSFGYINICSAVIKAAFIHDTLAKLHLDFLTLSETGITLDMLNEVKNDIVPPTYAVLHTHRSPTVNHPHGGCLAIIHKNTMIVKPRRLDPGFNPETFDVQVVRVAAQRPAITIVNVYRPPSTSVVDLVAELHDFLASLISSVTDRLLLCADLNCPGVDGSTVNTSLSVTLLELCSTWHIRRPMHALESPARHIATDDSIIAS
jgi:hypothetical protein